MVNAKRPIKKWIGILAGLCIFAGAIWAAGHELGPVGGESPTLDKPVRPVKTMIVQGTKVAETRSFPGLVQSAGESKMAFRVGGPLIEFDLRTGQWVEAGQILARIDPRDFEIKVARLTSALDEARASFAAMKNGARPEDVARLESQLAAVEVQAREALKTYRRTKSLWVEKAVPVAELDRARTNYQASRSQYEAMAQELNKARRGSRREDIQATEARIRGLETDLHAARLALADTRLKAPFAGYVNRKFVENFENVKSGDPILSLLDFSEVQVHTSLPESLVIRRSEFGEVTCTLDAYPGRHLKAAVKEVGRHTDSANQGYPLTVVLKETDGLNISPGMAATVSITLEDAGSDRMVFELPRSALFAVTEGRSSVWEIDPEEKIVQKREVETSPATGNLVRITSGLDAGARIVTSGARFLREGQKVRLLQDDRE